jgi:hypothetical protein
MVITPRVADRPAWRVLERSPYVGGRDHSITIPQRQAIRAGQLIVLNPLYVEIDFTAISRAIGEEISGLCGYDLFLRSIVTLDSIIPTLRSANRPRFG